MLSARLSHEQTWRCCHTIFINIDWKISLMLSAGLRRHNYPLNAVTFNFDATPTFRLRSRHSSRLSKCSIIRHTHTLLFISERELTIFIFCRDNKAIKYFTPTNTCQCDMEVICSFLVFILICVPCSFYHMPLVHTRKWISPQNHKELQFEWKCRTIFAIGQRVSHEVHELRLWTVFPLGCDNFCLAFWMSVNLL